VDIVDAFNSILQQAIFQGLWVAKGQLSQPFPFVCVFYVQKFSYFLVTIPLREIFMSSFCLLACAKVTRSSGPFLLLPIFMFCIVPQTFFLLVYCVFLW
jgi:hypothetical protein